jgi:putative hydrolase of the HAD superfamily
MIKAVLFDVFETLITHYRAPLYFGTQMAADAGVNASDWLPLWRATERDRSTGAKSLEDVLAELLHHFDRYSPELLDRMTCKRTATVESCFDHLHPEILPLLDALRARGLKLGIISNCFSEEAAVIRRSVLAPCFDRLCLSYELGVMKPDPAIYRLCTDALGVTPEECLFVGDGGSHELESARSLGMTALQAVWYLRPGVTPSQPRNDFPQARTPWEILNCLNP